MDGEKLNKEGLKKVWLKFWSLLKVIVGDVDVEGKGDLQTQVNSIEKNLPDVVSKTKNGLVPQLPNENTTAKYLRQDGTWATPPDTNTTYGAATQSTNGLMTAVDKKKLDGIDENANAYTYTHPLTHSASMIEQDAKRRFVSDTEKNAWNNKLNKADVTRSTAVNIEGQKALDAIEKNATVPGTMAYDLAQVNSNIANKFSDCVVVFYDYAETNGTNLVGTPFNPDDYAFFYIELIYGDIAEATAFIPTDVFKTRNTTGTSIRLVSGENKTIGAQVWLQNNIICAFVNTAYWPIRVYGMK